MFKIVFIADSWGYTKGGINSFNIDLCKVVATIISPEIETFCIVPYANEHQIKEAKDSGIVLITLHTEEEPFNNDSMHNAKTSIGKEGQVLWIIGHDVITGQYAIQLKELLNNSENNSPKVAVIHHMDYESYSVFKVFGDTSNPQLLNKITNQEDVLTKADFVFGVGPYLKEAAEDKINREAIMLIPGLDESATNKTKHNKFKVVAFGRMGEEDDIIKQCSLVVKSFGKAINNEPRMKEAILTIIGIENNSKTIKSLLEAGKQQANRQITINGVQYIEDRQTLNRQLEKHTLCIMPSLREGFGLAGWEAIGKEVPIIISDSSGLYKFLKSFGGTVEGCIKKIDIKNTDEDIETLANLIITVFNSQDESRQNAFELKRLLIDKGYTWKKTAQDFLNGLGLPINPLKIGLSPFKYLNSFSEEDKDNFYGRETEANEFLNALKNEHPYLLFFGKSGVGKTSFVNAKIVPLLKNERYCIKSLRLGVDIALLNIALNDFIQNNNESCVRVLFVDQFEELFINYNNKDRISFLSHLKGYGQSKNVKIILVFREDFLAEMHDLEKTIPSLFNNRYRLKNLSVQGAKNAILKPFQSVNCIISEALLNNIISDLKSNEDTIFPPHLQIVAYTLYEKYSNNKSKIDLEQYNDIGGIAGILREYIDFAIDSFDSQDKVIVKEILKNLVSSNKTKIPKKYSELKNLIQAKYSDFEISRFDVILQEIVKSRLIIKYELSETLSYELTHEYLIEKIKNWIDIESFKLKEIEDIIRQEQIHWNTHHKPMEEYRFEHICQYKNQLLLDDFQKSILLRNGLEYNKDVIFWLKENKNEKFAKNTLKQNFNSLEKIEVGCRIISTLLLFDLEQSEKREIYNSILHIGRKSILINYVDWSKAIDKYDISIEIEIRRNIESYILSKMAFVEEGIFLMGRHQKELTTLKKTIGEHFFIDETPLKRVDIDSFLIDKFLVSNDEIKELFPDTTYPPNRSNHPATSISLEIAREYAQYYNKEIPTEIFWEKAARGIDGRLFPWGNEWDINKCNTKLSGIDGTTPVDKYPLGASPYGCYDMAGNVWEWTLTTKTGGGFIVKGGSWTQLNILPWCAYKFNYNGDGQQNVGFRCIRPIKNDLENSDKVYSSGGVVVNVHNGSVCVLLCKKNAGLEWRLPKGMLNTNEKIKDCAIRETLEETGYEVEIETFIDFTNWSYEYQNKVWDETAFFYLMRTKNDNPIQQHDSEHDIVEWIPIDNVFEKPMYNNEKQILQKGIELYKTKM